MNIIKSEFWHILQKEIIARKQQKNDNKKEAQY